MVNMPPPNRRWVLDCRYDVRDPSVWYMLHDYSRRVMVGDKKVDIRVKEGFQWDSASIPKRLQGVISKWGRHSTASLCHDWLYHYRIGDRKTADLVFLQALKEDGVGWLKRNIMYSAVRAFGGRAWNT